MEEKKGERERRRERNRKRDGRGKKRGFGGKRGTVSEEAKRGRGKPLHVYVCAQ